VRSRWEAVRDARDAGRPPRRYYELTGAGAEAVREARRLHPDAAAVAAPRGAAPRPA
jgi:DNA-binding PadR family transcriptional regulator